MNPPELTLSEIFLILWKKRKFIVSIVTSITLLVIIISFLLPNWYKATAVILPPAPINTPFGSSALIGQLGFSNVFGANQNQKTLLAILKSRTLLETVVRKYNLMKKYDCEDMESAVEALEDNMIVEIGEEDQIEVSLLDRDQDQVAEMTNYIIHCLDSLNIALQTTSARSTREFIESRFYIVLDSLRHLEEQLSRFMEKQGLLNLEHQVIAGISEAATLKAEIMRKEIELSIARQIFDSQASEIRKLELEIQNLKKKYHELYSGESEDQFFPAFSDIPELEMQFIRMKRKADYYSKVLEYLGPQYEQAKIEEAKQIPTIQILDSAVRPEKEDRPRRVKIVVGMFLVTLMVTSFVAYHKGRVEYASEKL